MDKNLPRRLPIMNDKIVNLCGQKDNCSFLRWIFREFQKELKVRQFETPQALQQSVDVSKRPEVLILDAEFLTKSAKEFVSELRKRRPSLKIVLLIFPTKKDEIVEIIKANVVQGVILKPFTGEIVCNYLNKLL